MNKYSERIVVIGLGYVGLPLATNFAAACAETEVTGFDTCVVRVDELHSGRDSTGEVEDEGQLFLPNLLFTSDVEGLQNADFYLVTVPTPVDRYNHPDLSSLEAASRTVGKANRDI